MGRKTSNKTLSLAAALLGKKGGSMNTEAQKKAHSETGKKTIKYAHAALTGKTSEETRQLHRDAQMTIPEGDRKTRARNAVAARWAKREAGMSNDEFREIAAAFTAKELAAGLGVSYGKVLTWRRKVNPIRINAEDAKRIRAWIKVQGREGAGSVEEPPVPRTGRGDGSGGEADR